MFFFWPCHYQSRHKDQEVPYNIVAYTLVVHQWHHSPTYTQAPKCNLI